MRGVYAGADVRDVAVDDGAREVDGSGRRANTAAEPAIRRVVEIRILNDVGIFNEHYGLKRAFERGTLRILGEERVVRLEARSFADIYAAANAVRNRAMVEVDLRRVGYVPVRIEPADEFVVTLRELDVLEVDRQVFAVDGHNARVEVRVDGNALRISVFRDLNARRVDRHGVSDRNIAVDNVLESGLDGVDVMRIVFDAVVGNVGLRRMLAVEVVVAAVVVRFVLTVDGGEELREVEGYRHTGRIELAIVQAILEL